MSREFTIAEIAASKAVSTRTVQRWYQRGVRGVALAVRKYGHRTVRVTPEAWARFEAHLRRTSWAPEKSVNESASA